MEFAPPVLTDEFWRDIFYKAHQTRTEAVDWVYWYGSFQPIEDEE